MRRLWLLLVLVLLSACGEGGISTVAKSGSKTGVLTVAIDPALTTSGTAKSVAALAVPEPYGVRVVVTGAGLASPVIEDVALGTTPTVILPEGVGYLVEVITFAKGTVNRVLKYGAADGNASGGYRITEGVTTAIAVTTLGDIIPPAISLPLDPWTPNKNGVFAGGKYDIADPAVIPAVLRSDWSLMLQKVEFTSYPHSKTIPTDHLQTVMPQATAHGTVYAMGEFYLAEKYLKKTDSPAAWVATSVSTATPLYVHGGSFDGPLFADGYPPRVTSFAAPFTTYSTTSVKVTIGATDIQGAVTNYLVTQSVAGAAAPTDIPTNDNARWATSTKPSFTYTFTSPLENGAYVKLWAWARDAAGNVSAAEPTLARTVTCNTNPRVRTFTVPSEVQTSATGTAPVTITGASSAGGITGYLITTSPVVPAATDPRWTADPPTSYVYTVTLENGITTVLRLYAWVKDANGVSSAVPSVLLINNSPKVTAFTATAQATDAKVDVTVAGASYVGGALTYQISEQNEKPAVTDTGWGTPVTSPATYTATYPLKSGSRPATGTSVILYAWAKDANGSISMPKAVSVRF